jgi:hypothetical protein
MQKACNYRLFFGLTDIYCGVLTPFGLSVLGTVDDPRFIVSVVVDFLVLFVLLIVSDLVVPLFLWVAELLWVLFCDFPLVIVSVVDFDLGVSCAEAYPTIITSANVNNNFFIILTIK